MGYSSKIVNQIDILLSHSVHLRAVLPGLIRHFAEVGLEISERKAEAPNGEVFQS